MPVDGTGVAGAIARRSGRLEGPEPELTGRVRRNAGALKMRLTVHPGTAELTEVVHRHRWAAYCTLDHLRRVRHIDLLENFIYLSVLKYKLDNRTTKQIYSRISTIHVKTCDYKKVSLKKYQMNMVMTPEKN